MDYAKAFEYVKKLFNENPNHKLEYGFRDKLAHTQRVYIWACRLLRSEMASKEVVLIASIFHDVGYIYGGKNHPKHSAEICKQYLINARYESEFVDRVTEIIANHDKKELVHDPNSSLEQILLIEADNLDESGALSVLRDAISEGKLNTESYEKVYKRLCERSIIQKPNSFVCVTDTAKNIWIEKQRLYFEFVKSLKNDLYGFDDLIKEENSVPDVKDSQLKI